MVHVVLTITHVRPLETVIVVPLMLEVKATDRALAGRVTSAVVASLVIKTPGCVSYPDFEAVNVKPLSASPEIEHLKGINGDTASDGDVTQFSPLETVIVAFSTLEVNVTVRTSAGSSGMYNCVASFVIVWVSFEYKLAEITIV